MKEVVKITKTSGTLKMTNTSRLPQYFLPLFCLLIIYLTGLLIGPRQPDDLERKRCQINVYLKKPFGVTIDCDAPDFLETASDLKKLLHPEAVRQSRPGFIFLAKCVSDVVRPLTDVLVKQLNPTSPTTRTQEFQQKGLTEFPAPFLSYAILNFLFLCFALVLAKQIVTRGKLAFSAACALLTLAFNDVIKVFFYSPHTQIFNIFLPVLLIWTAHKIYNENLFNKPQMYLLMAFSGYGLTCYGTFLLLPVIAIAAELLRRKFADHQLNLSASDLRRVTVFAALFCAPMLLWMAYVISINGKVFFYEAQVCGQFSWMQSTYQEKGILALLVQWVANFWTALQSGLKFVPITLALVGVSLGFLRQGKLSISLRLRKLAIFCSLISLLYTIFFAFQGYFASRLSLVIFVPVWIWIAALNQHIEETAQNPKLYQKIFASLILIQGVYTVFNSHGFGG